MKSILSKLNIIQAKLLAPKKQFNSFGKYKYRSLEDILEAVKILLTETKTNLVITDELLIIGDRYYVKSIVKLICIETNESISSEGYAREEEVKKGMDSSQITGAASSYARKYACNGLFCIDDNKDADTFDNSNTANKKPTSPSNDLLITDSQIKRLYTIAKNKGFTDEEVKTVMYKLFKKESAKDLSKQEYDSICKRLEKTESKEVEKNNE